MVIWYTKHVLLLCLERVQTCFYWKSKRDWYWEFCEDQNSEIYRFKSSMKIIWNYSYIHICNIEASDYHFSVNFTFFMIVLMFLSGEWNFWKKKCFSFYIYLWYSNVWSSVFNIFYIFTIVLMFLSGEWNFGKNCFSWNF